MLARLRVLALAFVLTGGAFVLTPLQAGAVISGPCSAVGTADGKSVDLTTATEWHMSKNAQAGGSGTSDPELTSVSVAVSVLGISYPVFTKTGKGHGGDAGGPYSVQQYSSKARVIGASGTAGPCSGSVEIIFDGVSPTSTTVGQAGLIALIVGTIGSIAVAFASGCFARMLSLVMGLVAGVGAGLYAEEAGILDPFNKLDLLVPVAGAVLALILGYLVQMLRHRPAAATPPPPAPAQQASLVDAVAHGTVGLAASPGPGGLSTQVHLNCPGSHPVRVTIPAGTQLVPAAPGTPPLVTTQPVTVDVPAGQTVNVSVPTVSAGAYGASPLTGTGPVGVSADPAPVASLVQATATSASALEKLALAAAVNPAQFATAVTQMLAWLAADAGGTTVPADVRTRPHGFDAQTAAQGLATTLAGPGATPDKVTAITGALWEGVDTTAKVAASGASTVRR